jgi:hypothetical protein
MTEYAIIAFGALTGIALSSAVGFRIFLPFLVTGIAIKLNLLSVADDFYWLSSWPALAVFAAATVTEVLAYYIPVVDHALDVIGSPAAVVAGTMLTASMVVGMDEWLRWSLALIAGGGIAGSLHVGKSLVRGASTATTGGLGNPLVATAEVFGATIASILALLVPVLVVVVAVIIMIIALRALWRRRRTT